MQKAIIMAALCFLGCRSHSAQNAVLSILIENAKNVRCSVWIPTEVKDNYHEILLVSGKATEQTLKLSKPCFVSLYCPDYTDNKYFNYSLYLSPGDNLEFKADFKKADFGITVTGKGSNNNQPLMALTDDAQLARFYKDTLPGRVINQLNTEQHTRENNLEKYIALYHPSEDYIKAWKTNLPYMIAHDYYLFKELNKYQISEAYYRNYADWQKVTDSLFTGAKLDNSDALNSPHYILLMRDYLVREREHLMYLAEAQPGKFFREWYHTDTLTGKKLLAEDNRNLVQEKIINRYFTGKSAEFAFAVLFEDATRESDPANIPEIFGRFKNRYPNSVYNSMFAPAVENILANRKRLLTDKMVFMADNGTKFNTLNDVLAAMKGKTVLVDMWGTWCGPCREEIEKHSASIREHFKGKHLDYLYIANMDLNNGDLWKKLIAYFDLEGTHIMANKSLTDDIMAKVKGTGFPTLFIIKKDGTFEGSKSQYPVNEDMLIKQLEGDLSN